MELYRRLDADITLKSIYTLIPDIQDLLKRKDGWITPYKDELGKAVADKLEAQFIQPQSSGLRLSKLGPMCPRALWYSVHRPEEAEPMPPWAEMKFGLGHIVEAYVIVLAKAAGHKVEGEQDAVELMGIPGHRDCVIDGNIVDVKSCSSRQFQKIKSGLLANDDPFGYLVQLDGYVGASSEDPLVHNHEHAYLVATDRQLGHMCLYEHTVRPELIQQRIVECKRVVEASKPPACTCGRIIHGASGNITLDTKASYSAFKWSCFPHLRACLYSTGPVYFSEVRQWPRNKGVPLPEIDKYGKTMPQ